METSSSVFVNWKFVKTSSNIYFGNNCKFLSFNSFRRNLCCIPFLKKHPFIGISVPFLGRLFIMIKKLFHRIRFWLGKRSRAHSATWTCFTVLAWFFFC